MKIITIETKKKKSIVDITDNINEFLSKKSKKDGLCSVFIKHTTAAITSADLDPGTDLDMLDAFDQIIPKLDYRHPHDPDHVGDHIMSSIIGSSMVLPFENKKLILGTWQRVVIVEFKGPKNREVLIKIL